MFLRLCHVLPFAALPSPLGHVKQSRSTLELSPWAKGLLSTCKSTWIENLGKLFAAVGDVVRQNDLQLAFAIFLQSSSCSLIKVFAAMSKAGATWPKGPQIPVQNIHPNGTAAVPVPLIAKMFV